MGILYANGGGLVNGIFKGYIWLEKNIWLEKIQIILAFFLRL